MDHREAQVLIDTIKGLVSPETKPTHAVVAKSPDGTKLVKPGSGPAPSTPSPSIPNHAGEGAAPNLNAETFEKLVRAVYARIVDQARIDPILLQLLIARPELEISIEPRVVAVDGSTLRGRIARLMAAGWFNTPRALFAVRKELARTGSDPGGGGTLGSTLSEFKRDGFLIDEGGYVLAPGVKITEKELVAR